jgi:hypothetical protein
MTFTVTPTNHPDAVQLGDTIVQLQGLIDAYGTVLKQATEQLEQLELTPEQLERIERNACERVDLKRLAHRLTDGVLCESQIGTPTEVAMYHLLERISSKVTERIADATLARFSGEIRSLVMQEVVEAKRYFDEQTQHYFNREENRTIARLECDNQNLRRTLRSVLNQAFDSDELNRMAAIAIQNEPTTNQENA